MYHPLSRARMTRSSRAMDGVYPLSSTLPTELASGATGPYLLNISPQGINGAPGVSRSAVGGDEQRSFTAHVSTLRRYFRGRRAVAVSAVATVDDAGSVASGEGGFFFRARRTASC